MKPAGLHTRRAQQWPGKGTCHRKGQAGIAHTPGAYTLAPLVSRALASKCVFNGVVRLKHDALGIVAVYATLLVPSMILFESFLSYLGLGVQEPMTSWGALLEQGAKSLEAAPWELAFPAGFLVTTLFCFNFIGDGLRDALDPKDR